MLIDRLTINPRDNQQVFDYVVGFLRKQGKSARDPNPNLDACRYRVEIDGDMCACAAGCLIPDEDYTPNMEGCAAIYMHDDARQMGYDLTPLIENRYFHKRGFDARLIDNLQIVHDNWGRDIEKQWQRIASVFDLTYTPPAPVEAEVAS